MPTAGSGTPSLLVVGAAARDIDLADPRGWRLGGTVMYASLAAAKLGVKVRALVGADEQAATAHELELLRAVGAEVELVRLERGPIFHNRQTPRGRIQYGHQASDPIPVTAVPERWQAAPNVLLGPVAGEVGDDWAGFDRDAFVALAWQGLLREVVPGEPVRRLPLRRNELVERADLLAVGDDDMAPDSGRLDGLLRDGSELVLTSGPLGALSLRRTGGRLTVRHVPALPPRRTVDETGAGDIFLAALCAGRILAGAETWHEQEWRLLALATAAASVSVEGTGLEAVPDCATVCEALLRLRTTFPPPAVPEG
jgi:pfkB family carbohydrate kinase